jgi:c-di-GMP-binding flagellar brake protein YcgR
MQQTQAQSRRSHFRIPLRTPIQMEAGLPVLVPAMLLDLSGGGAQLASRIAVEANRRVSFRYKRAEKPDLVLTGSVASRRYAGAQHIYYYGVKFEGLSESVHDQLVQEIVAAERKIIMQRRGERDLKVEQSKVANVPGKGNALLNPEANRTSYRVAWTFPVEYTIKGIPGTHRATAADISAGGMQVATDMILRREWSLQLHFTLPETVLEVLAQHQPVSTSVLGSRYAEKTKVTKQKPFPPMTVKAEVTPGIQQSRGRYVHGLKFKDVDPLVREELLRFVHAAQLSKRRLAM